jgi:hypothetical protein
MSFLSLPTSTSAGRPESRICLVKRKYLWYTDARVEAPCPPVVTSAKGDKIDPVPAQMASYLACLCSSARLALVRTSLRGSSSPGPGWARLVAKGSAVDELLVVTSLGTACFARTLRCSEKSCFARTLRCSTTRSGAPGWSAGIYSDPKPPARLLRARSSSSSSSDERGRADERALGGRSQAQPSRA